MIVLHLAALMRVHWLTVSLSPGKLFLGLVPSLEDFSGACCDLVEWFGQD
jgi:hypothetical protein